MLLGMCRVRFPPTMSRPEIDEELISFTLPLSGSHQVVLRDVHPEYAREFCRQALAGGSCTLESACADVRPDDFHSVEEYSQKLVVKHGECYLDTSTPRTDSTVPLVVPAATWQKILQTL
jgi:hypothetical protein